MDLISLGIDVQSFDESKKKILADYVNIFNTLEKWDGHVFNPVMGGGIVEFNTSLRESSKLLDEVKTKMSAVANTTSKAGSSKKEETSEMKEYARMINEADKAYSKLKQATTDEAKELAKLKVQLTETKKALIDEAKSQNESIQARLKAIEVQKQANIAAKQAEAENKKKIADEIKLEKQAAAEKVKAEKEKSAAEKAANKQAQQNLKDTERELKRQQNEVDRLSDKFRLLKDELKLQQKEYVNNFSEYGAEDPRTMRSLANVRETQGIVTDLNEEMNNAAGNASRFGRALTGAFSTLRTIAYILPGLGIAGIFNAAFEGIASALKELDLFSSGLQKQAAYELKVNSAMSEQLSLFVAIIEKMKEIDQLREGSNKNLNNTLQTKTTMGASQDVLLPEKAVIDYKELSRLQDIVKSKFGSTDRDTITGKLDERLNSIKTYTKLLSDANEMEIIFAKSKAKMMTTEDLQKSNNPLKYASVDEVEATKKSTEKKLELANSYYKILKDNADEYFGAMQKFDETDAERKKFFDDEALRRRTEISKSEISLRIAASEKILNQDISSEKRKIAAMKDIAANNKNSNLTELNNVLDNLTSTDADKAIARSKYQTDNAKIEIKLSEDIARIREEYRQRYLKATTELNKDEIEKNAIANEKIYKNEENSLEARIKSYDKYLTKKQTLQDLEYALAREALSLKANDPTAKKELEALDSNRNLMKANIQADAEAQMFNIVSTSLKKELKLVLDANNIEIEINKKAYAEELNNYNSLYSKKQLTLKEYLAQVKVINSKYKVSGLDEDIVDDKSDIGRLNEYLLKERKLRSAAKDRVDITKNEADNEPASLNKKRDYDEAVGEYKARDENIIEAEKSLQIELKKLDDDELKRARAKTEELISLDEKRIRNRNRVIDVIAHLETELYHAVVSIASKNEKIEEEKNANRQKTVDEGYESEIAAIEKSTLSSKDKNALDIQLNQQKLESDKASERERAKMRHDEAVFEKDLSIAQIIIATSLAIMKAAPDVLLQFEAGATGAIALGEAVATKIPPIPAYKEGTKGKPHKGGLARTGEGNNPEIIFEPYKSPYLVLSDNVSYLPAGTQVVPISDSPDFSSPIKDSSWEQTRWLAKQISKNNRHSVFSPINNINIDLGTENWKRKILGN